MTRPEVKSCTELTERERRYLLQAAHNAYDTRDREALERLVLRLLAMVPSDVPKPSHLSKDD